MFCLLTKRRFMNQFFEVQEKTTNYAVPALEKGLRILEDLSASDRPLSLAELAELQGRSRNEIYRMLASLEQQAYVRRDPDTRLYSLSLKLFRLSHNHPPLERLRTAVEGHLRELAAALGESCHACVLDGGSLTVIAQRSGGERIRLFFDYGAEFDPLETCSGKLLLSRYSGIALRRLLEDTSWQGLSPAKQKTVLSELGDIRKRDILREPSQLRPGVTDLAVIVGHPQIILATLAISHLPGRPKAKTLHTIEKALRNTSRAIESELGI
jgi:DNA-binding IclR family transcriptional regulator